MTTVIEKDGKEYKVITQQYVSGLYVAIYKGEELKEQYGLDVTEKEFHTELREENTWNAEGSTIINVIGNNF